MKKLVAMLLAVVMVLAMAGCSSGGTQQGNEPNEKSETLKVALNAEPTALLAPILTGGANAYVNALIFDQLVWYNSETGEAEPYLATSWKQIDELTWEFKLRDDVYGHDGSKFTAEDVLYTFKIGVEGGLSFYAANFDIEKCKVIDDTTIQLATTKFVPDLVNLLCVGAFYMTTEEGVSNAGGVDAALINPLGGTGKYKFVSWEHGVSIKLERNDDYWGEKAAYKYIEFSFISDDTTRLMALQSGQVDAINTIATSQTQTVSANENLKLLGQSTLGARFVIFNCSGTPLEDVRVRQAIAYALDREAIFNVALMGFGAMTDTTLSTLNPAYVASEKPYYSTDVNKAKALLADAGYDDANQLSLKLTYAPNSIDTVVSEIMANQLTSAGIKVTVESLDDSSMRAKLGNGEFEILLGSANAYTLSRGYNVIYGDGGYLTNGWAAWYNQEFDAIVDSQGTESDVVERGKILAPGFEIVREEVPIIGLFNDVAFAATSKNVDGLCLNINGEYSFVNARPASN